jgi:hypothetical protein
VERNEYTVGTPMPSRLPTAMLVAKMNTSNAAARRPPCTAALRRRSAAPVAFRAFIAYTDLNAAREAMRVINEVLQAAGRRFQFKPMLWRYDQLGHRQWREISLEDATGANVVVLASGTPGGLPRVMAQWVGAFLACNRGRRATLVALMGRDDAWTISLQQPPAGATAGVETEPDEVTSPLDGYAGAAVAPRAA